jgi:hypothetical protein
MARCVNEYRLEAYATLLSEGRAMTQGLREPFPRARRDQRRRKVA